MMIKTRREAAAAGERKYMTGRPCNKGHESIRYTVSGICCQCQKEAAKSYSAKMNRTIVSKALGHFGYDLHPDDHAVAHAYCQALDLARGRTPKALPPRVKTGAEWAQQCREEGVVILARQRAAAISPINPPPGTPHIEPSPRAQSVLAQLEAEHNLPPKMTDEMKRYM